MKKLVTDNPQDNMEVMMNLAFVKDKEVWIRGGSEEGEDCTLIKFAERMCQYSNGCCHYVHGFPSDIVETDIDAIGDVYMDCSMSGCPIGTAYFIAIQAAELRERLRVCEPINFHCMGFQDAEKILTYAGIGCDVLSPDGFIRWLKNQMLRDPRFKDEFRGEQALYGRETITTYVDEAMLKWRISRIKSIRNENDSDEIVNVLYERCKKISESSLFTLEQVIDFVSTRVIKGSSMENELDRLEKYYLGEDMNATGR